jgi:hypothetical protein
MIAPVTLQSRSLQRFIVMALAMGNTACSAWLPRVHSKSSTFETFDAARQAVESLEPMRSDVQTLARLGISPTQQPNLQILTQADILRKLVPSVPLLNRNDLNPGVRACLEAHDACRGWEFTGGRITRARTGNFIADFTNFSRRTETTGWRFNALILLVNDTVVYRTWGGQPTVNELEVNTNPLGPVQDMGPAIIVQP